LKWTKYKLQQNNVLNCKIKFKSFFSNNPDEGTNADCTSYSDGTHLIRLNIFLKRRENKRLLKNTFLHELAHVLTSHKEGHNDKWRKTAERLGCDSAGSKECTESSYTEIKCKCRKDTFFWTFSLRRSSVCRKCKERRIMNEVVQDYPPEK
jgi:hypothetical protein